MTFFLVLGTLVATATGNPAWLALAAVPILSTAFGFGFLLWLCWRDRHNP